ncbi:uncharacterized protein LOC103356720 [Stegastes partitus]|uniref:Uncharacterized protein LOC103356720 n=1 Tax=Stegastes partitus TaxID=144197 RepID=A0A9Y4MZC8_9TELE|nr:PREDICTED: uncharacterized protein LOC103356720 [Stegastes partitus]
MGCSWLLILGLVLNVAHCLEILGLDGYPNLEVSRNVTAVLGEDAYLSCRYLGDSLIQTAKWKRQGNSKGTAKSLAGFRLGKPFGRDNFSNPESLTNLTVQMKVSSVGVEGEYICEFESDEENFFASVFVSVVARPHIQILVDAETINDTHFQSVSCSAVGGRPTPQISWLVGGLPPSDHFFTVNVTETLHSNGTSTLSSVLRFPTRLQDENSVTCVVQHPTLPQPELTTAEVESYTRPNVTIKAEMVQRGENDSWVVSCVSSGGRPDTDISLALNTTEELHRESDTDSDVQKVSVYLPATEHEGRTVTCVFDHPKFTQKESRVLTLPTFYLSGVQLNSELGNISDDFQATEYLELQEGESDVVIGLEVSGNVPRYNIICSKDDGPLPEGVELVGMSLVVQGPVEHQHAGLYECVVSYHHLEAALRFNVTVKAPVVHSVPPTIGVDLRTEDGRWVIECSAADAVPAANVSWLLPEGVSEDFWFNSTSQNGSHSVRGVLLLPACSPQELTAECVINHPAFEEPENRSIILPLCARPNITISASTEWKDGHKHTKLDCSADSSAPAAAITWHVGNSDDNISHVTEAEVQADGSVSARSSVHFLSSLYAGQNLTCTVQHPSLEAPERRTIHLPVHKAPLLSVSLVQQQDPSPWLAVCRCRGEGVGKNLAWILPENAKSQTSLHSEYEGHMLEARLTYQFPLARHEGQDLSCVYQFENGNTEKKTVHVPRYYITSLRVLNHTTPLKSRYTAQPVVHRLSLHENHHNQKILLRVEGNVPEYNLNCQRSDGSSVPMEGAAMILQSERTDKGLYTCLASFYHHTATVNIQVEVINESEQFALMAMICISTASAILLILVVTICVCCKRNTRKEYKKRESVSALTALMHEPTSPQVKKSAATEKDSKEYAQLVSYSIVIDVKSTV